MSAYARRECDNAEVILVTAAMEYAGGKVFAICEDSNGRWHVFARFRKTKWMEKIDTNYHSIIRAMERSGAFVDSPLKKQIKQGKTKSSKKNK